MKQYSFSIKALLMVFVALGFIIDVDAEEKVPPVIKKLVFESAKFTAPLIWTLPRENSRKLFNKLRSHPSDPSYFQMRLVLQRGGIKEIDKGLLNFLLQHGYARIETASSTSRNKTTNYKFLFYNDSLNPYIYGGSREHPRIRLADRKLKKVNYTNKYEGTLPLIGAKTYFFALTFTYELIEKSFPELPIIRTEYQGKAKAYLDPDDGKWKVWGKIKLDHEVGKHWKLIERQYKNRDVLQSMEPSSVPKAHTSTQPSKKPAQFNEQGGVIGQRFLHPALKLQIQFPNKWVIINGSEDLTANSPDQQAYFRLEVFNRKHQKKSTSRILQEHFSTFGAKYDRGPIIEGSRNGYRVAQSIADVRASSGNQIRVYSSMLIDDQRFYLVSMWSKKSRFIDYQSEFENILSSFSHYDVHANPPDFYRKKGTPQTRKPTAYAMVSGGKLGDFRHGTLVTKSKDGDLIRAVSPSRASHTHPGVDIVAPANTPIRSPISGEVIDVIRSEEDPDHEFLGYMAIVKHSNKIRQKPTYSMYLHMIAPPPVDIGQKISIGDELGRVGATGNAVGNHTHFEVRHFPSRYLEKTQWNKPWNIYGKGNKTSRNIYKQNWEDPELVPGLLSISSSPLDSKSLASNKSNRNSSLQGIVGNTVGSILQGVLQNITK